MCWQWYLCIEMKVWQMSWVLCLQYVAGSDGDQWGAGRYGDSSYRGRVWGHHQTVSVFLLSQHYWTLVRPHTSSNLPTTTDTVVTTILHCGWKQQGSAKGDSIRGWKEIFIVKWLIMIKYKNDISFRENIPRDDCEVEVWGVRRILSHLSPCSLCSTCITPPLSPPVVSSRK